MARQIVVLGSGYTGAGSIKALEESLDGEADLTWVSDVDHHLVLHEAHRCIRDPEIREKVAIPISEIKSHSTEFRQGEVVDIDTDERVVHLDGGSTVDYDYLLVGLGTQTAFYGIDGLDEYAHTLKNLEDVLGIHEDVVDHAREATQGDPVDVVVGGAGLSGIQTCGELAELRDERDLPIDVTLVEGLDNVLPGHAPSLQAALRDRLEDRGITIRTGEFIGEVDAETVYVGEEELDYDVLVWTGGITGHDAVRDTNIEKDERSHRINAGQDFQTNDERVFAVGDCALIDQPTEDPAPPTAQAAWQAAEVAGRNITRAIRGQPLERWTFDDKGTVVSVGEASVAHDVYIVPFVDTFGGLPATLLKKAIAANWIRDVAGTGRALDAWSDM